MPGCRASNVHRAVEPLRRTVAGWRNSLGARRSRPRHPESWVAGAVCAGGCGQFQAGATSVTTFAACCV